MKIYDISQPLHAGLPVWPGDTAFASHPVWHHATGPVAVSRYTMSTHAGTHADAPFHYDPAGETIDSADLEIYVGPARLVDARDWGPIIGSEHLSAHLPGAPPRVLLRTYHCFPEDRWTSGFTTVAADAITSLARAGVRLIGVDAPSLDPEASKAMEAHRAVRDADMRILEGLVLDDVPPGDYELIAFPLRLAGLDAAPVRAVLRG